MNAGSGLGIDEISWRLAAAQCGKAMPYRHAVKKVRRLRLRRGIASKEFGKNHGEASLTALVGGTAANRAMAKIHSPSHLTIAVSSAWMPNSIVDARMLLSIKR
jgi:hypothetical protein